MIYDSIDTLPAYNFYKIIETSDHKYLFDDLKVNSTADLEMHYNELFDAVNKVLGGESDFDISFIKLHNKYVALSNIVCILKVKRAKDIDSTLTEWLKTNGYVYEDTTFEQRFESIKNLERQLQGLKTKIDLRTPVKKDDNTKFNMYEMNIHLSKFVGYQLDMKKISIAEYATIINEYSKK